MFKIAFNDFPLNFIGIINTMVLNDRIVIVKKAETIASDIFKIGAKNMDTALLLIRSLYKYGEDLVETIERKKKIPGKIECKVGCSYCCYAQVSLTPPEAVFIGHFIKENYSLRQTDALMKRSTGNIRLTKGKSLEERIDIWEKTPCIFLENDKCSIYEVRPFICRAWHSLSVDQCERAFHSGNKDAEIDSTPYRNIIFGAVRDGLSNACDLYGCESIPIEIASSIKIILQHPSPEEAWIKGEKLFNQ